jgi:molybdopterin/thiamine biosynthesis adenylyltransferase/molybdopterin synthase catalytic subunit/rhodanese-related sulfurtransferase
MAIAWYSFRPWRVAEDPVLTFALSSTPIDLAAAHVALRAPECGGYASFEGWVRNLNAGERVTALEYEAFAPLAVKEAERVLHEAAARFGIEHAACIHRVGRLAVGELAVWVGVSAAHRDEAFRACRYIIDEVKHRLPIWKKEYYENGDSGWVNCERCAPAGEPHAHAVAERVAQRADYSRQIALREVGAAGQERLRKSRVLIVGCGGLGVPVITYLAGAGVGQLGLVDADRLEASNLHRQTLYALSDVGLPKAELAAVRVRALNPEVHPVVQVVRLSAANASALIEPYDLVIDCSDNFATRFVLNDTCMQLHKPVIFASVYQYEGQLQVVRAAADAACLRCVWPEATPDGLIGNCAQAGVLGPVPGVLGCMQALEALKLLAQLPGQLGNEVLVVNLLSMSVSKLRSQRAVECRGGACVHTHYPKEESAVEEESLEVEFSSLDDAAAQGFVIVDVREPQELQAWPTPCKSARHIPMRTLLYGDSALDVDGKYLLVCAVGQRSLVAANELRARGMRAVFSQAGGVSALAQR